MKKIIAMLLAMLLCLSLTACGKSAQEQGLCLLLPGCSGGREFGISLCSPAGIYVPRTPEEKAMQRALLQYFRPENRKIVIEALKRAGRRDLIGSGPKCLVDDDSKPQTIRKSTAKKHIGKSGAGTWQNQGRKDRKKPRR